MSEISDKYLLPFHKAFDDILKLKLEQSLDYWIGW